MTHADELSKPIREISKYDIILSNENTGRHVSVKMKYNLGLEVTSETNV